MQLPPNSAKDFSLPILVTLNRHLVAGKLLLLRLLPWQVEILDLVPHLSNLAAILSLVEWTNQESEIEHLLQI